jgi:hypothetical protein
LSYELQIPGFVKKAAEGLTLEHDFFAVPWSHLTPEAERTHKMVLPYVVGLAPVLLAVPGTLRTELTFVLPAGVQVKSLPGKESFSSEFALFELSFEKQEDAPSGEKRVLMARSLTFKENNLSVEQYGKLRELANLLQRTQREKVVIEGLDVAPPAAPEGGEGGREHAPGEEGKGAGEEGK